MTAAPAETPEPPNHVYLGYAPGREGQEECDQHGRQVDDAAVSRHARPGGRQLDAGGLEEADDVGGPAARDGTGADRVLEHEVPADEPGEELADGGVGVGVGAAGDRHHAGELGVRHADEAAGNAGEQEGQHERRAGILGGGDAGQDEDAGADDDADAEQGDVEGTHGALEVGLVGIGLVLGDALGPEDIHDTTTPSIGHYRYTFYH